MKNVSKFHVYSLGIVAENKKLNTDIIKVTPIELTPFLNGELDSRPIKKTQMGVDKDGVPYMVSVEMDSAITAQWLREGKSNRRSSPDVRRGERVLIFRFADTDKFFWESMGWDDHLRKGETVTYSWSGTLEEDIDSTSPENAYTLELSTHKKLITFKTSKANGEPFSYTVQLNTGIGYFCITDDVGNFVELDSEESLIRLKNLDETEILIEKEDMTLNIPNDLTVDVGNNFKVEAGSLIKLIVGGSTVEITPDKIVRSASVIEDN